MGKSKGGYIGRIVNAETETVVLNRVIKMGYTKKVTCEQRFTKGNKNAYGYDAENIPRRGKNKYSARALR